MKKHDFPFLVLNEIEHDDCTTSLIVDLNGIVYVSKPCREPMCPVLVPVHVLCITGISQ